MQWAMGMEWACGDNNIIIIIIIMQWDAVGPWG